MFCLKSLRPSCDRFSFLAKRATDSFHSSTMKGFVFRVKFGPEKGASLLLEWKKPTMAVSKAVVTRSKCVLFLVPLK